MKESRGLCGRVTRNPAAFFFLHLLVRGYVELIGGLGVDRWIWVRDLTRALEMQ